MASINDVTGDRLVVGGFSAEGGKQFELIFGKKNKKPVEDWDEERMDVISQNGNEGLHYDNK